MTVEQMEIPVAEMDIQGEVKGPETEYAIAPDGTVGEASKIKQDMAEIQEKMQ